MVGDLSRAEDYKLNAMDELMTDFGQVDIEALRVEIEKNKVDDDGQSQKNLGLNKAMNCRRAIIALPRAAPPTRCAPTTSQSRTCSSNSSISVRKWTERFSGCHTRSTLETEDTIMHPLFFAQDGRCGGRRCGWRAVHEGHKLLG